MYKILEKSWNFVSAEKWEPWMVGLCRNICKIDITSRDVRRAVRLGKATENNERLLLIAMDEETKKREIFLNLNKIRDAERPFNKVVMTHDLTVRQREELKELGYTVKQNISIVLGL